LRQQRRYAGTAGRAWWWITAVILVGIVVFLLLSLPPRDTQIPPQPVEVGQVAGPAGQQPAADREPAPPQGQPSATPEEDREEPMSEFSLTSSAFGNNAPIPREYTADGRNVNPPLTISGVPAGAVSLALIMDDPDAPVGTWDHWIVWNIPPGTREIPADSVPAGAVQGANGWGRSNYGGPSPPSGTHRYFFKLYALDTLLDLKPGSRKQALERAMEGHIVAQTKLVGLYSR